eukprot:ANDGO_00052.mRNA.1 Ubiquitin thioesterase OTU1
MRLRIRSQRGNSVIDSVSATDSFLSLLQKISLLENIAISNLQLKVGFPPVLLAAQDAAKLSDLKVADGDLITVGNDASGKGVSLTQSTHEASQSLPRDAGRGVVDDTLLQTCAVKPRPSAVSDAFAVRREVPSNNSCLFLSFLKVYPSCAHSAKTSKDLREVIAKTVQSDPVEFNDAILGKTPQSYVLWIRNEDHWGGAIELAILAKHFQVEICAWDIRTAQPLVFGEAAGYVERVYLLYDGIHYDALVMNPVQDGPVDFDISVFDPEDTYTFGALQQLVQRLKDNGQFTDVAGFTLQCGACGAKLVGEKAALEHAQKTGHSNFSESSR